MDIEIRNCNNIDVGNIEIRENILNIKYAINGTGKSTIAKAILSSIDDNVSGTKKLLELTPFKHLNSDTERPEVKGVENISQAKVFDENYINEFIFQPDELVKGSFDIFIRGDHYDAGIQEINSLVETTQLVLAEDKDITELIQDFTEISKSFGTPVKQGVHASSGLAKAFKGGNKVSNIPEGLEVYKDFIQHPENYKWIGWQLQGSNYVDISSNCPYCTSSITEKKETIKKVGETYDSKSIESLNRIVATFQRLNKYFSEETREQIDKFVKNVEKYTDSQIDYLLEVKRQIDDLSKMFQRAQRLGFSSLKDVDQVIDTLRDHRIEIDLFVHLKSKSTKEKVNIVNDAIDNLQTKAGLLQGSIARQKVLIERLVKENCTAINDFLRNAGYRYSVKLIEEETEQHRLKLVHDDIDKEVSNVKSHLSFGERNAFSLILFMFHARRENPDLIVLDDPISSFDKNKKYAIIDTLFRGGGSFRGKTVLLLTHDFEPIVDIVYHHTDRFVRPFATFVENQHGTLSEKLIGQSDVRTFIEINKSNLEQDIHVVNKLVYLRRLYEVTGNINFAFDVISNISTKEMLQLALTMALPAI